MQRPVERCANSQGRRLPQTARADVWLKVGLCFTRRVCAGKWASRHNIWNIYVALAPFWPTQGGCIQHKLQAENNTLHKEAENTTISRFFKASSCHPRVTVPYLQEFYNNQLPQAKNWPVKARSPLTLWRLDCKFCKWKGGGHTDHNCLFLTPHRCMMSGNFFLLHSIYFWLHLGLFFRCLKSHRHIYRHSGA